MTAALRLAAWAGDRSAIDPAHAALAARTIAILTHYPRPAPWGCYLAQAGNAVVGICAFKAAPDREGTVEIAYLTLPTFERRGHAAAMIGALLGIARVGRAAVAIAHTAPRLDASARALRANGFVQADAFDDPEDGPVWYWECVLGRRAAQTMMISA